MKAKTSPLFDDLSGKAGNIVAARNRGGLYVKPRRIPRNPRTSAQMNTRGILSSNSKSWEGLTQAQREAWNAAAINYQGSKNFGENVKLSGINAFVKFNNNLSMIMQPAIDMPPILPEFPSFGIESVTYTAAGEETPAKLELTLNGNEISDDFFIICRATAAFSAGRESMTSALRIINSQVSDKTGKIEVYTEYVKKFGSFPEIGKKIHFEIFLISKTSGVASLKQSSVWLREE
ncbi:hypothetical protein [Culturomica massiliensis]|jgi:hypothetical protein|uniref:hypothetical protein n=1 Tax=Culturomica massiliensis TaxID=1841857 RepID=UPI000E55E3DB|nr:MULTISPECIES: hypothetical protein [Odoribacteraceae]